MLSLLLLNHCPGWWQTYRYFPAHMLFLKRQHWQKYLLCLSSFFCEHLKVPSIFVCSVCALQLLPLLEMTSRQWERRVSPSLLRVSVCYHGSSSSHFLPEWVFLCSFIFVCTLQRSYKAPCLHCHIWGFMNNGHRASPSVKKHHERYTRACKRTLS